MGRTEFRNGGSSGAVREAREPDHSVGKGKRGVWEGPICREKGGLAKLEERRAGGTGRYLFGGMVGHASGKWC